MNATNTTQRLNLIKWRQEREKRKEDINQAINKIADLIHVEKREEVDNIERDNEIFQQFKTIIKGEQYFSIDHINALGLAFDVLIVLTKKNTGKTSAIYRMMREHIEEGKKFIYMRTMQTELKESANHFLEDAASPVFMVFKGKSAFLFKKSDWAEILELQEEKNSLTMPAPTYAVFTRYGYEPCGRAVEFKFCQNIGGGQFEGYKSIFFDECLSYNPRKDLNASHFANWGAFTSSVARNKTGLRVYMFGNMRPNNELLQFYGVHPDQRLRYKNRRGCLILYVNCCDLYPGYSAQGGAAQHAAPEFHDVLENNALALSSSSILKKDLFDVVPIWNVIAVEIAREVYLMEIRKVDQEPPLFAVLIKRLTPYDSYKKHEIYSDKPWIINRFEKVVRRPTLKPFLMRVLLAYKNNVLGFADMLSLELMGLLYQEIFIDVLEMNRIAALARVAK